MRTRAALLLAAFAILVIVTSAIVTSHFGMRDWPTPPMPDTATRLITPTEAAGRISDRSTGDDDGSARQTAAANTARGGRVEPRARGGHSPSGATGRRGATRRGDRSPTRRDGRRRSGGSSPADDGPAPAEPTTGSAPADTAPAAPTPAPQVPAVESGAPGESQARPHDSPPPVPTQPNDPDPALDPEPQIELGDEAENGQGKDKGRGRRGPLRDLLDALP